MDITESLLRAILATTARGGFSHSDIYKIVATRAASSKHILAYNLCDGKTPQTDIGKKAKLDAGNFSRSIGRWIEAGVVVRVGPEQYPLHVFPLTKDAPAQE
jgi:hypothetical protein